MEDPDDTRPILIVPYMWIGDFVRGHTVVRVLKQRWPNRPVDLLVTTLCAPLVDYMPGVRAGDRLGSATQPVGAGQAMGAGAQLRARSYGTALVMPRTWKSAIAPALAGIPERVGFVGEAQFGPAQPLALGRTSPAPHDRQECGTGAARRRDTAAGMAGAATRCSRRGNRPLAAGAWPWRRAGRGAGAGIGRLIKRWTYYAEAARMLAEHGIDVWVIGGPGEKAMAAEIVATGVARPGPYRQRLAKRHSGDGGGHRRDFEQFRPDACRGRDRNAHNGHFRTDQPLSLGTPERARSDDTDQNGRAVPTLPPSGLHHERPSLHEGYSGL